MPVDLKEKKLKYLDRLMSRVGNLVEAIDNGDSLVKEYFEVGYGSGDTAIADEEIQERYPHIQASDVSAVITTFEAFILLRSQGHGTNLNNFRP